MARWKKILGGIALTAFVAGGTFYWRIARSGPALVSADPNIKLVEKPCHASFAAARCGVIIAPLDYNDPKGKTVEIGFVKFPAIGFGGSVTLQLVGGGPGIPITFMLAQAGYVATTAIRMNFYDRSLLFIEPRGIALSTRLDCPAYHDPKLNPLDPAIQQLCADQIGPDIEHFTTENTARDFDRVRQALGIAELDLYGFSYGTNLSAVYASRFPKHIRTLALDGSFPLKTWDLFMPTHYAAMKRQLKQFCDRSGKCKTDEVLKALSWAAEDLRKAPRPLDTRTRKDRYYPQAFQLDVETLAGLASGAPEPGEDEKTSSQVWRLPFISALLKAYRQQDWADLEMMAAEALPAPKGKMDDEEENDKLEVTKSAFALYMTITCQDFTVPWKRTSTIDQRRIEYKENAAAYERQNPNTFAPFTAAEWGMRKGSVGYYDSQITCPIQKTPLPAQSDQTFIWPDTLPVLVVNGDYDFQTTNEDAQLAAAQFKKAQFALFKHHGHAVLPGSLCASKLVREFLNNKRVADPMKCLEADATGVSLEKGKEE